MILINHETLYILKVCTSIVVGYLSLITSNSQAKPNLVEPVNMQVIHDSDSGYHFVTQTFSLSAPSLRQHTQVKGYELYADYAKPRKHRVWLAIPNHYLHTQDPYHRKPAKVLYLLDGNAVIDELDAQTLAKLANTYSLGSADSTSATFQQQSLAPILVFLGYQTPYRFDVTSRAYDYTPPLLQMHINKRSIQSEPTQKETASQDILQNDIFKELSRYRLNGGADHFYQLIETQIKPWMYKQLENKPQFGVTPMGDFLPYIPCLHIQMLINNTLALIPNYGGSTVNS